MIQSKCNYVAFWTIICKSKRKPLFSGFLLREYLDVPEDDGVEVVGDALPVGTAFFVGVVLQAGDVYKDVTGTNTAELFMEVTAAHP